MQIMDRDDLIKLDAEYEAAQLDTVVGATEGLKDTLDEIAAAYLSIFKQTSRMASEMLKSLQK